MSSNNNEDKKTNSLEGLTVKEKKALVQATISKANMIVAGKTVEYEDFLSGDFKKQSRSKRQTKKIQPVIQSPSAQKIVDPDKLPAIRAREKAKYEMQKYRLIGDNIFLTLLVGSGVWGFFSFKTAVSFGLGGLMGTMYLILLGRFVESLGSEEGGGGGGPARLGLAVALVLICSKNREVLEVAPAIAGFFMYQASTLLQALYVDDDDALAQ